MQDNHYFTNSTVLDRPKNFEYEFLNETFKFNSNNGVFSKNHLDKGSLLLAETAIKNGILGKILDMGCGIGTISIIIAKKVENCEISMFDINERAVKLSKENANLNFVQHKIKAQVCDINNDFINKQAIELSKENASLNTVQSNIKAQVCDMDSDLALQFDNIITNPPIRAGNKVLFDFFQAGFTKLKDGGKFYVVLRKKQGAETYIKKIESIFNNASILEKKHGYVIVRAVKQINKS